MSEQTHIIQGIGVTRYFGGLAAVLDVDFFVDETEIVGLIGPNGAGKTTLFNVISGAFSLTRGYIEFLGEDVSRLSIMNRNRRGIARTFQTGKLFPSLTVYENVYLAALFGGNSQPRKSSDAQQDALELLEFVGLLDKRTSLAKDITLAIQRRLEVARALATKPRLLLLDEVLAGLNPTEVAQGVELIQKIRQRGITIFIVEHIMKAIMGLSDRILVLHHGEKIAEGKPGEIASNKLVQQIYLGEEL